MFFPHRVHVQSLRAFPVTAIGLSLSTTSGATTFDNQPKIFIHLKPVNSKDACDPG